MSATLPPAMYRVVVNGEGQYSTWPSNRAAPEGWDHVAFQGSNDACLGFIRSTWNEMRPRSIREPVERPE